MVEEKEISVEEKLEFYVEQWLEEKRPIFAGLFSGDMNKFFTAQRTVVEELVKLIKEAMETLED